VERAREYAEVFLNTMAPDELARSNINDGWDIAVDSRDFWGTFNFSYTRQENGIPFRGNGIHAEFNAHTGRIMSYSLQWFDNVTFPSIANVLTPLQALTGFVAQNGSRVFYVTTGERNATLVYGFDTWLLIDPFTGRAMEWGGEAWDDETVEPDYGDVAGHWSERIVNRLLENNVFLWGGRFEPDRVMTELEFLQYIMLVEWSSWARLNPQAFFAQRGRRS
jgi:hypothetical protein